MSLRQTPDSEVSLGLLEQPGHLCVSVCITGIPEVSVRVCLCV